MIGSLQIQNGKYSVVLNMKDKDGKRKQKWISTDIEVKGDNKRKAEKALRNIINEYEKKNSVFTEEVEFSDYILQWMANTKKSIELSTWEWYSAYVNQHIIPYFKINKVKLSQLSPQHIQKYYDGKFENGRLDGKGGLSAKTIKNHHGIIRKALQDALKFDLIMYNPADRVTLPKVQKFIGDFYSIEQANALIKASKDTELYIAIVLAVYCGLRRSELLGLKWSSVNFKNKTITIQDTVVRVKTVIAKQGTKNNSSYRTLQLTNEIINILKNKKTEQEENKLLFEDSYTSNDYVLKRKDGTTFLPNTFTVKVQAVMEKAGLPIIRLHDLRHTTASLLLSLGFNLKEIQVWLGHSDIGTTMNIYAHLDTQSQQNIANNFSKMLVI